MEQTLLKQHKELEELIMDIGNVYQTKNEVQRLSNESHAKMDKILQRKWLLLKNCKKFQRRPRGSRLSVKIMSLGGEMNSRSNILYFIDNGKICGGMQCRILFRKILERFVEGMREMKGYTCIKYLRWKRSYHHFNMNFQSSFHNQKC